MRVSGRFGRGGGGYVELLSVSAWAKTAVARNMLAISTLRVCGVERRGMRQLRAAGEMGSSIDDGRRRIMSLVDVSGAI